MMTYWSRRPVMDAMSFPPLIVWELVYPGENFVVKVHHLPGNAKETLNESKNVVGTPAISSYGYYGTH